MRVIYKFVLEMEAVGPAPEGNAAVGPAASNALNEGVDALRARVKAHGFDIVHTGYGVKRVGTVPDA